MSWQMAARLLARAASAASVAKRGIQKAYNKGFGRRPAPVGNTIPGRIPAAFEKFRDSTYQVGWAVEALTTMGDKFLPRVIKSVQVKIVGSTGSRLQDLFYLAMGIASSRIRRFAAVGAVGEEWAGVYDHILVAHLDFRAKTVQVELAISIGGVAGEFVGKGDALRDIKSPPPQIITAVNQWPRFLQTGDAADRKLTLTGGTETMLVEGKGKNPHPDGDGISRTKTDLVALVAGALMPACVTLQVPPKTTEYKAVVNTLGVKSLQLPGGAVVPQ